jgi:hypothetical protein
MLGVNCTFLCDTLVPVSDQEFLGLRGWLGCPGPRLITHKEYMAMLQGSWNVELQLKYFDLMWNGCVDVFS